MIVHRPCLSFALSVVLGLSALSGAAAQETARDKEPAAAQPYCFGRSDPTEDAVCIGKENFVADVCRAIDVYATEWQLPAPYFARLIWQESRFNPSAVSPAGAQGIAQFMPGTARMRGVSDPFHPTEALSRSAQYLRFLQQKFGSLGLAAAAYNSGEGRTERITTNGGSFPPETQSFVRIITGVPVENWVTSSEQQVDYTLKPDTDFQEACLDMASAVRTPDFAPASADWRPWGVQLAQAFSPDVARSTFQRLQAKFPKLLGEERVMMVSGRNPAFGRRIRHSAMIGRDTREDAQALCAQLNAAGGACIVRKN